MLQSVKEHVSMGTGENVQENFAQLIYAFMQINSPWAQITGASNPKGCEK